MVMTRANERSGLVRYRGSPIEGHNIDWRFYSRWNRGLVQAPETTLQNFSSVVNFSSNRYDYFSSTVLFALSLLPDYVVSLGLLPCGVVACGGGGAAGASDSD
jgi:hypothetical protein